MLGSTTQGRRRVVPRWDSRRDGTRARWCCGFGSRHTTTRKLVGESKFRADWLHSAVLGVFGRMRNLVRESALDEFEKADPTCVVGEAHTR